MKKTNKKPAKRRVNEDALHFVSMGLAAASGHLSMDAFAQYIVSRHPRVIKNKNS